MTKTAILNLNIIDVRGTENQIIQKCGSQEKGLPACRFKINYIGAD
ncbi:MAG: hypothetical protein ACE5D0_04980 [Fidelibacterota bacterium]